MAFEYLTEAIFIKNIKFDKKVKKSEYNIRVIAEKDIVESFYNYSHFFYYAGQDITNYLLDPEIDPIMIDDMFIALAFLYRHSLELMIKAIAFKHICENENRKKFISTNFHDIFELFENIECYYNSNDKLVIEWLRELFLNISEIDRCSDSFRYPFQIKWDENKNGVGKYVINKVFKENVDVDLERFSSKFEAAFEILKDWFDDKYNKSQQWKSVSATLFEETGNYCNTAVIGISYGREYFMPYINTYFYTAKLLKKIMKEKYDFKNGSMNFNYFIPMCYLYRNCVELNLKALWFNEISEAFQTRCKEMEKKKHNILGMWNTIIPHVGPLVKDNDSSDCFGTILDYCNQLQNFDGDSCKFRYPVNKQLMFYFEENKWLNFVTVTQFFETLNNAINGLADFVGDQNSKNIEE